MKNGVIGCKVCVKKGVIILADDTRRHMGVPPPVSAPSQAECLNNYIVPVMPVTTALCQWDFLKVQDRIIDSLDCDQRFSKNWVKDLFSRYWDDELQNCLLLEYQRSDLGIDQIIEPMIMKIWVNSTFTDALIPCVHLVLCGKKNGHRHQTYKHAGKIKSTYVQG